MIKAVIIDDELFFRKNLISNPIWDQFGIEFCAEATNGASGIEIVKEYCPDIILADINMPIVDGLEFISTIRSLGLTGKIIIISGYDNFNFAKRAMQLGVDNYLLKPVQEKELYETVLSVITEIAQEQADSEEYYKLKEINRRYFSIVKEQMTKKLMLTKYSADTENSLLSNCKEIDLLDYYGKYYVVAVSVLNRERTHITASTELISFISSLIQAKYPITLSFSYPPLDTDPFAFLLSASPGIRSDEIILLFEEISVFVFSKFQSSVIFSIFGPGNYLSDIFLLYHHASNSFIVPNNVEHGALYGSVLSTDAVCKQIISVTTKAQIISCLRNRNTNQINKTLDDIKKKINNSEIAPSAKQKIVYFLLSCATKYASEIGFVEYTSRLTELTDKITKTQRFDDKLRIISDEYFYLMEYAKDSSKSSKSRIVEQAIVYINDNFRNCSLSIEDISKEVFSNYTYLCCTFKKEIGETINRYILETRIKHALMLMDNGETSITNIASLSGFSTPNYFCRCFKKEFDITPTEYMGKVKEH